MSYLTKKGFKIHKMRVFCSSSSSIVHHTRTTKTRFSSIYQTSDLQWKLLTANRSSQYGLKECSDILRCIIRISVIYWLCSTDKYSRSTGRCISMNLKSSARTRSFNSRIPKNRYSFIASISLERQ